jgi:hypothetical protein
MIGSVQVVGRPCAICGERVNSELVGVACLQCASVFHDACTTSSSETYRTPRAPSGKAKKPKAPSSTLCPTCGSDVRALKRERDRLDAQAREAADGRRRSAMALGGPRNHQWFAVVRIFLGLLLLAIGAFVRWMSHP